MVSLADIERARETLAPVIRRTDLIQSPLFTGSDVYIKAENLQRTGSFKLRGAYNKISNLSDDERKRGVIASSAGNHAQGVALTAQLLGIRATIVMPATAPLYKVTSTRSYGAEVVLHGSVYDDAYAKAMEIVRQSGATFIHPFDDPLVIAGQGTVGLEILEDMPDVKTVIVPVGGGGIASGIALAIKSIKPDVRVIGVEPENAASMKASIAAGARLTLQSATTIADGIAVKTPGELTLGMCKEYLDDIVTVDEDEIAATILDLLERGKVVSEGAGAASVAALLVGKVAPTGKTVAVLTGGNIDVTMLSRIIDRGLRRAGRLVVLEVRIADRPGQLGPLLDQVADLGANIVSVVHERCRLDMPLGQVQVVLEIETQDMGHIYRLRDMLRRSGYKVNAPDL